MNPSFDTLQNSIDQCLLSDQNDLRKMLSAMRGKARSDKPWDRLLQRFQALQQHSQARRQRRDQAPLRISYDDQLPISAKRDEIAALIKKHQVLVLAGETGSGKTTQLPKICLELGRGSAGLIGHTQPRRLAARTVANRIAEELQVPLGSSVGYQVRFSDQSSEQTRVKLMTDGILLAEIQNDPLLSRYDTLIIDEAHERSLNIDFLLGYLKQLLPKRPDLKLIITSATIDLQRFSSHFSDAPIIEVSGRTYPVAVHYLPPEAVLGEEDERTLDQPTHILRAVRHIEQQERQAGRTSLGDILVFLSGEREIREAAEALRRAQLRNTDVLPLYARLSNAEQNRIFHPGGGGRRIVLATNVAETSLTVPGIRYVIDTGYARISRYSYRSKVQRLPIEAIAQASANQRKGRCGRIAEGVCVRLYSEEDFLSRPAFTDPEIQRSNLAAVILQMEAMKLGRTDSFPFIDPPDSRLISDGVRQLQELGALDARERMTALGRQLCRLPVDPRIGRMLLAAAQNNALTEMLVIASALSVQDPRERPLDKQQAADEQHRRFEDPQSDFVSFYNLWQHYEPLRQESSQGQLRSYCKKHFLSFMRMREWRDVHRQLHLACKELGLHENTTPAGYAPLHQALLAGLLGQIGFRQEDKTYLGARNRKFLLFPGSGLRKKQPKWLMAAELVETRALFARCVAQIEPDWIEPLAGSLLKRSYSEPHWEKKPAQVVAFEQVSLYGLVIIPKRRVHFGPIDPEQAQQIFIRSALVEGEYRSNAPFFQHNRSLLQEVEALEDKSRRRDILIDEEQLFAFYQEKLLKNGGEQITNGAGFEKWRKTLELADKQALFLTREELMRHQALGVTEQQYPDQLLWQGMQFKLSYHFSPGADDDGVSVSLPAAALALLPVQRLEWLVPGMLRDKCIALIKGLPKTLRKNFVPVPDYVDAILQTVAPDNVALTQVLGRELRRMSGVWVSDDQWDLPRLDAHHRFNLKVLDDDGKLLAQGRDWLALRQQFAEIRTQAPERVVSKWEREQVESWDFGALPASVTREQAGMKIPAFPALVAEAGALSVKLLESAEQAEQAHCHGVIALLKCQLPQQVKRLRKQLPALDRAALMLAKVIRREALQEALIDAAIQSAFLREQPLPRTQAQFDACLTAGKAALVTHAEALADLLLKIATRTQRINKALSGSIHLEWALVLKDIRFQLDHLVYDGFLRDTPLTWLEQYPRYLEAIEQRLARFKQELPRQRVCCDQLQHFWQAYTRGEQRARQQGCVDPELATLRWMLEEYRVSLFAQQLGTRFTVSEKRVKGQVAKLAG